MKVSGLSHFPLGRPVPARDHAVCVSLPTVRDVVGYEEKNPETLSKIKSGYPRFVRNFRIGEMEEYYDRLEGVSGCESFFFSAVSDYEFFRDLHPEHTLPADDLDGLTRLRLPKDSDQARACKLFQQHSGTSISSRWAEDILYGKGIISQREFIHPAEGPSGQSIRRVIARAHGPEIEAEDVVLASSGANAFFSLFRAAAAKARMQRKKIWVRLGWLYLDTIEAMNLLAQEEAEVIAFHHPREFEDLLRLFREQGNQIAGVITEFPTNPLLQSFDLVTLRELCDRHHSLLVIDPTMASPKNAKVSQFADVVVNSLTKYAGWEGDVMMGSLVFPKASGLGRELMSTTQGSVIPPFRRDLHRLEEQISFYDDFVERVNRSTLQVADFLLGHPKVKKLYWSYQESSADHYESLAGQARPGCVISFELRGDFEIFYDSLKMLKSPSFGTEFSICCPYVYLAHYSLIHCPKGKRQLEKAGISPQLLRLSIGLEPVDEIIAVLAEALG